ncbi:GNAT family N-acetyltransferase [Antrihabitans sp. YC3-6]|uniref:GNAT family N-acetyltransferase n=1 Tax=Antrihabitans stalagmiti TaxID=2799499 RepID=A0A934NVV2_9NOCA|nr:GNAT family N-acetyltransferase [Antrihabitans stalagmiti]MBJ8342351.1 GNAT family N-acetyltransferase [Antrihabitans stalagmiti]
MTIVRPTQKSDIAEASRTLARAFFDDPVMTFMLPDDAKREKGLTRLFGAIARYQYLSQGGCEVATGADGAIGGATLWAPPGGWKSSGWTELRSMPAMIMAFGSRMQLGGEVNETMKANHPEEPHWYLSVIGTDPSVRGGGFGHSLMTSRLSRCDAEHAPAYLESSKPDNVPYYERFGFEVTREVVLPKGGPTLWAMWRNPR